MPTVGPDWGSRSWLPLPMPMADTSRSRTLPAAAPPSSSSCRPSPNRGRALGAPTGARPRAHRQRRRRADGGSFVAGAAYLDATGITGPPRPFWEGLRPISRRCQEDLRAIGTGAAIDRAAPASASVLHERRTSPHLPAGIAEAEDGSPERNGESPVAGRCSPMGRRRSWTAPGLRATRPCSQPSRTVRFSSCFGRAAEDRDRAGRASRACRHGSSQGTRRRIREARLESLPGRASNMRM